MVVSLLPIQFLAQHLTNFSGYRFSHLLFFSFHFWGCIFLPKTDRIHVGYVSISWGVSSPVKHYWTAYAYKLCSVKKDTKINQVFCLIKSSEIIFIFFTWIYTWLYGSWHHQRILKKYPFWKHASWFSSEVSKLTSVFYPWNDAFSGMKK